MRRSKLPILVLLAVALVAAGFGAVPGQAEPERDHLPPEGVLTAMTGGNTVGAVIREDEARADGYRHIDTPAMIERLKALHVNTYTFGIWDMATDWEDLRTEFAPAAAGAGIDIWVYIVPPSECFTDPQPHLDGRCSRPYKEDYVAWAEAIADLSVRYPNVRAWAIDDFLVGNNSDLFTKEYIDSVRAASDAINPDLGWYVTMYYGEITDPNLSTISDSLDGVIYPYLGANSSTRDATWVERRLDDLGARTSAHGLNLVLLLYSGRFLDGINHPTEDYAADVIERAKPYLADGRLEGIVSYANPMRLDLHQPSFDHWARNGNGRLSLNVMNHTSTPDGAYAEATQKIAVDAGDGPKTLRFHHRDQYIGGLTGYQLLQVLVDGAAVWESDISTDARERWIPEELDLTRALAGKTEAQLTFRLHHKKGVGWWPTDLGVDDVAGDGITVRNGGFESPGKWKLRRTNEGLEPLIDRFAADRPTRIFNAVGKAYAEILDEPFTPVEGGEWPNLEVGPENRAMYGNGRLRFNLPEQTPAAAGSCASATQQVTVTPDLSRYELSFWHADPLQAGPGGYQFKEVLIDGQELWKRDTQDYWPWLYMHGSDHQGVIDVTEFVSGKSQVDLTFRLCHDKAVQDYPVEVSFDHVETIGLELRNGGFETANGWELSADDPLTAEIPLP